MQKLFLILLVLGFTLSFSLSAQTQCCKPMDTAMATARNGNSIKQEVKQEKSERLKLKITGMTCAGCASHVHKVLSQTPGVVGNTVEYPGDIAVVEFNPDKTKPQAIIEAIEKNTSYTVEVVQVNAQKRAKPGSSNP